MVKAPPTFATLLEALRIKSGLSKESLASAVGIADKRISEWELGAKMPNRELSARIVAALRLTASDADLLLGTLGHTAGPSRSETPARRTVFRPTGLVIGVESTQASATHDRQLEHFQTQLARTQQAIEELRTKVRSPTPADASSNAALVSSVERLQSVFENLHLPVGPITAPVVLPPPEDMEVRLISSTSLERLEEYRSEVSKWSAVAALFVGSLFGIVINLVTGGHITTEAFVLFVVFGLLGLLCGVTARGYDARGNRIRQQILRGKSDPTRPDQQDDLPTQQPYTNESSSPSQ